MASAVIAVLTLSTLALLFTSDPRAREARRVRSRLKALATAVSFKESDAPFVRLGYPGRIVDFFGEGTEVDITLGSRSAHQSFTRSELKEGAAGLRATNRGVSVEFTDVAVTPDLEQGRAEAHLTAKIFFLGDHDYFVQEFRVGLVKADGEWRIRRMATVRTME